LPAKKEIFKVQLSLFTNLSQKHVLVYNKDRTKQHEGPVDNVIKSLLGEKFKSFWYGHINKKRQIILDAEAPWQEW
jgi:hypothetical protein